MVGIVGSAVLFAVVGRRILAASGGLRVPVACYLVAILTMATLACASLPAVGVVGAVLFVASDSLLGWRMFVVERSRGGAAAPTVDAAGDHGDVPRRPAAADLSLVVG